MSNNCRIDVNKIDDSFPIKVDGVASFRDGQREAIEFIVESFNSGKRFVVIEGPTGSGKSAIGMTMADLVGNSYYLTSTKILQDQLVNDFADVVELRGRNAYPCTLYDRLGQKMVKKGILKQQQLDNILIKKPDCDTGFCKSKIGGSGFKCGACFAKDGPNRAGILKELPDGFSYSTCPYYEQVYKAINSRKVLMNFSSFIYQTASTTRFAEARDLIIIDECHNVESQLMDYVTLTINDSYLADFGIFIPKLETANDYAQFFQKCNLGTVLEQIISDANDEEKTKYANDMSRTLASYNRFISDMSEDSSNWIVEYSEIPQTDSRRVVFKPIFVSSMTEDIIFRYGIKILLMSATVLNVDMMASSLGINKSELAAYRMKNRFPVKNRPIYLDTVAKFTGGKDGMVEWGPKLVTKVNELANKYRGKRGIIHTHNFAIQELLKNKCANSVKSRFLHQQDFQTKQDMLAAHSQSTDTILVAPAMHEGIDLYGDLSRFQIICKVPYPNHFENKQLARRIELDRKYLTYLVSLKTVQSYGRSIRSADDYADTYILDESIYKFLSDAERCQMIPQWFTEAIVDR